MRRDRAGKRYLTFDGMENWALQIEYEHTHVTYAIHKNRIKIGRSNFPTVCLKITFGSRSKK